MVGLLVRRAIDACLGTEVPELREQTLVADGFHILRLVSAILMDISEEWESSKTYLPQISNN
jgi:hypothetical protein